MAPRKPAPKPSASNAASSKATRAGVTKRRRIDHTLINVEPKTSESLQITRQNQLDSPLLKLPAELRNRIFEYALTGHTVLLQAKPTSRFTAKPRMPKDTLALLAVSRQVYAETAMIPFTKNIFCATSPERLAYLLRNHPATSISRVSNIQIDCAIHLYIGYSIQGPATLYAHTHRQEYWWRLSRSSGLQHMTILTHIKDRTRTIGFHEKQAAINGCKEALADYFKLGHPDLTVCFEEDIEVV